MKYEVFLTKSALKAFKQLPASFKTLIRDRLKDLESFPDVSNVVRLSGLQNKYRLRVGGYRILFELSDNRLIVFSILSRKKAYRKIKR